MAARFQNVLVIWCWIVVVFGAVLMGGAFAPTYAPTRALFGLFGGSAPEMTRALRFSVGLMGAVTFGWGLTLLALASASHLLGQPAAHGLWKRVAVSLGLWCAVDSAISVATGFGLNAVSNAALTAAFVFILWRGGVLTRPRSN